MRGFEVELAARPLDGLNVGANLSYSKIEGKGGQILCNVANPLAAGNPINFCTSASGQTLNQQPIFQATVNGGYELPITDALSGYVRFNVSYIGKRPGFGNFQDTTTRLFRDTPSYEIVDLFAGLTGGDGAWSWASTQRMFSTRSRS